jgi:hypothetical protein
VDLKEVEFGLLSAHHADVPRAPGGRSAMRLSASSSSCSSRVLACFSFDPFCRWSFVAQCSQTVRNRVPDSPCREGWSAGPSQMVCY